MANTGMVWNEQRNSLTSWGDAPTRIEPVTGRIHLAGIENARSVIAVPLNGAGVATETTINAVRDGERWTLTLSAPALSYRIEITR